MTQLVQLRKQLVFDFEALDFDSHKFVAEFDF